MADHVDVTIIKDTPTVPIGPTAVDMGVATEVIHLVIEGTIVVEEDEGTSSSGKKTGIEGGGLSQW